MQLISQFIKTRMNELIESNVRLRVVGRRDRFSADLRALIHDAEVSSAQNSGLNLTVALDYGWVSGYCRCGISDRSRN